MSEVEHLQYSEEYTNHEVFRELKRMQEFYDCVSTTCFPCLPLGTRLVANHISYIFCSLYGTLDSIQTLLELGRINDAIVLVRKYYDDVLVAIYLEVLRIDQFDWVEGKIVKDIDVWLNGKHRIPSIQKILSTLKKSNSTKELYPLFKWKNEFQDYRKYLDDSVHCNSFKSVLLNCNTLYNLDREKELQEIQKVVRDIFTMHLAFLIILDNMCSNEFFNSERWRGFTEHPSGIKIHRAPSENE